MFHIFVVVRTREWRNICLVVTTVQLRDEGEQNVTENSEQVNKVVPVMCL